MTVKQSRSHLGNPGALRPDSAFTHEEILTLLLDAWTAVTHREGSGGVAAAVSEDRLKYLRGYSLELLRAIDAADVATGHLLKNEVAVLMTGLALAAESLHGAAATPPEDKEK